MSEAKHPEELVAHDFKIARKVLERITEVSAADVAAVSSIGAVNIEQAGGEITSDIAIVVNYKAVYPEVASLVQQSVSDAIKGMTGLKVKAVNVSVERLDFREK